jgi:hypothetical protein
MKHIGINLTKEMKLDQGCKHWKLYNNDGKNEKVTSKWKRYLVLMN